MAGTPPIMNGDGDAMNGDGDAMNGDGDAMNGDGDAKTPAEQLTAAQDLVTAADALVFALTSDSTADDAAKAYAALGAAQTALHAANSLTENKIAAKQAVIDDLQARVDQLVLDLDAANMVATQAASVKTALATATTMVDGLTNDSMDADVTAARGAVTAAQAALDATTDLPQDVSDNLRTLITSLGSRLRGIETAHMGIDPAVIAEGMRVAEAIGPMSTRPTDPPFMANGRKLTEAPVTEEDMDDDFAMAAYAPASITGWQGAKYTRTTAAVAATMLPEMTDTVIRYTDQADATDQAYTVYYTSETVGMREAVTAVDEDGVLQLDVDDIANHALFMGDFGITAPYQMIPAPENDMDTDADERIVSVMGSFNGVPGTFDCDEMCSRSSDKDGNLRALGGAWTFTPAEVAEGADPHMVAGVIPDPDYLTFGHWRRDTVGDDGTTSGISAFAMGNIPHTAQTTLTGSAKYAGPASGMYMKKTFDGNGNPTPIASGQFTADSELTAYFGQVNDDADKGTIANNLLNSISGSVTDFRNSTGDMINPGWTVELNKGDIDDTDGSFMGTTTGMGAYNGQFYGPDMNAANEQLMPSSAAGTFDGHFSNGHVLGAFAARKK